ncbi:MAG: CAP domain-containing protein [Thermoleophilaceae bacterium]
MLRRFSFPCALAVLVAMLATAPGAMAARACESANATPAQVAKRTMVRATLCTINAQRERHGLRPLKLTKRLSKAARRHARDMVRRSYFAHDTLGGGTFVDRIRRTGYLRHARSWSVGENLAWGTQGSSAPRAITAMWMDSPGHRANILNASFREVGIGLAIGAPASGSGPAATYATDFGTRR